MSQRGFPAFFASLQYEDSPHFSPERVVALLGLKRRELAAICQLRPDRFRLAPTSPDVQRSLRELVRVLGAAYDRFEDERRLAFWFKNCPIAPCEFRTPAEMCAQGRAWEVLECLATQRC
ncbi:hypothetical protein J5226_10140 [Lysobacter sp. K5869]|uniref:hypothetical protein n=1 Tax=Lysobacter sp. K5869 TaxID=2820808 RepID=UPI001C060F9C|nr:hypothetical protein [Lysobacter sp. K5869]QWP78723.1 hypothetical protein J5226_10140 [Lysobacter sp. K5869]